ncbi:CRISPR-associated Cse1 family protein [Vreelandella songnenensis]|uniref:CRISPR-associated Cse1 family protein n=1 Tax=Vreelandella songnenensis TaxID=1176243 RepID=A0A2T0V1U0_9GAMM|nr:type I-E CRISPR-associated protein Cse1/CasA [Halomonas songnenensis]PRY64140.1 CRISPR-associated Cse1 family protein [Halomonas songnenensis]
MTDTSDSTLAWAELPIPAYDLLREPWLSVRLTDGTVTSMGLLETFERSQEIVALADTAPPSVVAQYRLLLAITHRALTMAQGRWRESERAEWYRSGLPVDAIRAYLEHWQERFWLFHDTHPFMQAAVLDMAGPTRDKLKSVAQISLASATGNTPVVFDHAYDSEPAEVTPAQALNTLLGFLQFTPGGLVKVFRGSDKAGALANTAAVIPLGQTLAETIALGLHPDGRRSNAESDLPSWEREPLTEKQLAGEPVFATGPNDRYTRQSRAVLFKREDNGNIRWLRFGAGLALGDSETQPDPMASFRPGHNGPVRISFTEGRATWRDLPALVPGPATVTENQRPAAVIAYAASLHQALGPGSNRYQPLLVAGLASDQAKLLRWRMEQVVLPASLMVDPDRSETLQEKVADAEALYKALRALAGAMLADSMPDPENKETKARAQSLLAAGPLVPTYFATAERALSTLMAKLAADEFEAATGHWNAVLRDAAQRGWRDVVAGLGSTPRGLRAEARYYPRLLGLLTKYAPKPVPAAGEKP